MDKVAKARFLGSYANLPMNIRKEIVSVIDGNPISWNVAYLEIRRETKLGEKILNRLISLDIL
jgi:hypothetical protein